MTVPEVSIAESLISKGEDLLSKRRLSEAVDLLHQAEQIGIDADRCAAGCWMVHMLRGQFELAWKVSDAIRRRGALDPQRFWQGESLRGKCVMLRCLHGFGDAVQFLRYAPYLRDIASRLIVEVPPRLLELASCFDGVEEVITWSSSKPASVHEWDVQIEIMELPYVFRTQLGDLPLTTRYLKLPTGSDLGSGLASSLDHAPRVGLVWTAGAWNAKRSVPFTNMKSLLEIDSCEFWDLQDNPEMVNADMFPGNAMIQKDDGCRNSIMGLAVCISQLDLVITVDTLAAHLGGALCVPTWLLLQHQADWRWLLQREDSPWYPSLRLFRQREEGNWDGVICATKDALRKWSCSADSGGLQ